MIIDLQKSNKNKTFESVSCWLAILYTLGTYYRAIGPFTISQVLAFILMIYIFYKRKNIIFIYPWPILAYFVYFFITRIVFGFPTLSMIAPGIFLTFLLWGVFFRELTLKKFLQVYRLVAFVNIGFFFLQELLFYTVGYRIIGIMTFLPLTIGGESFDLQNYEETASLASRSSALFSEPAHFAQFLLPLLAVELFYVCNKKAYYRCAIYFLTLISLSSGNAFLGLIVIMGFFVVKIIKKMNPIVSFFIVSLMLFIAGITYNYIKNTEYGENLLLRTNELESDPEQVSSGFVRIFRGFYIWDELSPLEKITGINNENRVIQKIRQCDIAYLFEEDDTYMNGLQSIMIYTGYIGIFLFVCILIWLWYGNNIAGKCLILILSLLACIASIYLSSIMMLFLLLSYLLKKNTNSCRVNLICIGKMNNKVIA